MEEIVWGLENNLTPQHSAAGVVIVRKETYPYPAELPEGRWAVYEITLPSRPQKPVNISFHSLSNSLALLPVSMVFTPDQWNVPQDLVVFALQGNNTGPSSYDVAFNMSLQSSDKNFDQYHVPNFNLTVESNNLGERLIQSLLVCASLLVHLYH